MSINIFDYKNEKGADSFTVNPIEEHHSYTVIKLSYKSPVETIYDENNTVVSYVYKPKEKCDRVIIFLHYLFEKARLTQRILSLYSVAHNFCAVEFTLPYHLERTPEGYNSGELFLTDDPHQNFESYRQSIVDLRLLADFLNFRDINKIGIVGISMGALVLNTLMGVDNRFYAGIPISGAGGLHYIVSKGIKKKYVKNAYLKKEGEDTEEVFEELDTSFHEYIKNVWNSGEVKEPPAGKEWFLIDPLTYAKFNSPRKIFMINGEMDTVMPKKAVLEFREAVGNPPIEWLPTVHTTTTLLLPFVFGKMYEFFEKIL